MVMRVPDYSIKYNFPESEGLSFKVRTDRRNNTYTEFTGKGMIKDVPDFNGEVD